MLICAVARQQQLHLHFIKLVLNVINDTVYSVNIVFIIINYKKNV